jgi:hypothetical protein
LNALVKASAHDSFANRHTYYCRNMVQKKAGVALACPMNNNTTDSMIRLRPSFGIIYSLAAVLACLAACASRSSPHLHQPGLSLQKPVIKTVGLLPPMIRVYEEQYGFGTNKPVLQDEWSQAARKSLISACTEAAAARGWKLVLLSTDEPELEDMAQLYNAVDFSIQRHARDSKIDSNLPAELFPEKIRFFDYSLGPSQGAMERNKVDAVWIVRGFNLVPSPDLELKSVPEGALKVVLLTAVVVASFASLHPVAVGGPIPLQKLGLSSALVDRSGNILSYSIFDGNSKNEWRGVERTGTRPESGELEPPRPTEIGWTDIDIDLRDPRVAGHYVREALAGYAAEAKP